MEDDESVRLRFCVCVFFFLNNAFQFKTCFPLSDGKPRVVVFF